MVSSFTELTGQMIIAGSLVRGSGREVRGFDPRTGTELEPVYRHGDKSHVEAASVGARAIERFLRPVCYQEAPKSLLPSPIADGNPDRLWRRIDGQLTQD